MILCLITEVVLYLKGEKHYNLCLGDDEEFIIEKSKRKMYAGSIGYFSANKNFDTCIALRTALIKNNKFYIQSGAGIVADSVPEKEYLETVNKAKALIASLS